ncbi:MAG: hypothetical protein RMJ15_01625 [Nitrososphaerota archaeon]|nr:hypothetical protein [Candidatus Bathyarchaeota archaeon]MDW8022436.1 hypothetical protein [Nitrososphaerota archaeon]
MASLKKRTILLGLAFISLLFLASFETTVFFTAIKSILQNSFLAVGTLFLHNVLVVSLILLGMSFYVNLVMLNFLNGKNIPI